jgi:hypothetical protein
MRPAALLGAVLALALPLIIPVWVASCAPTVGALPGGDGGLHYSNDAYVVPSADVYLPDTPPGFYDSLTMDAPLSGPDANLGPDTGGDGGGADAGADGGDGGTSPDTDGGTDAAAPDAT